MFLLQTTLVSSATDKIIKVSFTLNNRNHIGLEKFEIAEGTFKNPVTSPSLYTLQIKDTKNEIIEKTNFAPAFFILSKEQLIKINQTTITKDFLYKGSNWRFLEIYKEDKLLYQADVEEQFCTETGLCKKWIKIMFYITPIIVILLLLAYLFIRKKRMVSFK